MKRYQVFTARLLPRHRKRAVKFFLDAIRVGLRQPAEILAWVRSEVAHEIEISAFFALDDVSFLRELQRLVATDNALALDFARWAVWWGDLSLVEREWWTNGDQAAEVPTDEQALEILMAGYPVPNTQSDAKRLIAAIRGGKATEAKKAHFARDY